jgi:hypothetical protein
MARVIKTIRTAWNPERAFAYMSDFSHSAEWDPGVVAATRRDADDIGLGSAFELTVRVAGRQIPFCYEITDFSPGRVTFTARSGMLESVDTVSVARRTDATEVNYDARIHFRGLFRLADPLLALGFRGVARRAIQGLERRMGEAT